jgi:hypothetical protein
MKVSPGTVSILWNDDSDQSQVADAMWDGKRLIVDPLYVPPHVVPPATVLGRIRAMLIRGCQGKIVMHQGRAYGFSIC